MLIMTLRLAHEETHSSTDGGRRLSLAQAPPSWPLNFLTQFLHRAEDHDWRDTVAMGWAPQDEPEHR
jgi:hypothetical protein